MNSNPVDETKHRTAEEGSSAGELALLFGLLALVVVCEIWAGHAWPLFNRFFWLDEIYTHTLIADPSFAHAMKALAGGVETHPPALYVLLRGYTRLIGSSGEVALRSFALLAVLLGLVGIYACLRQVFTRGACVLAVLAAWCHPLVMEQAFNARFYGPWLAITAWFAYFLTRARVPGRPWTQGLLAILAVLLCTIHYFGIVSLAIIAAGEFAARRRLGLPGWSGLVSIAAGPVALAVCLPLLRAQGSALSEKTWMAPLSWSGALDLYRSFVESYPFRWLILAAWLSVFWSRDRLMLSRRVPSRTDKLWGVGALLFLPALMLVFSALVQPVYDPRYSFPAVAGVTVAAAWLGAYCTRLSAVALGLWLMISGGLALEKKAQQSDLQWVAPPRQLIHFLEQTDGAPILFELPWQLYVVYRYAPHLRSRCALLGGEPDQVPGLLPGEKFARDLAKRYSEFYSEPPTMPFAEALRLPRFVLVTGNYGLRTKEPLHEQAYPGFHVRRIAPAIYEIRAVGSE